MKTISTILVLAITVEALIEYVKLIVVDKTVNWKQIVSLVIGVTIALLAGADLFEAIGIEFLVPYVGCVLTGIIFSRGSNYVADFISLIQGKNKQDRINDIESDELEIEVQEDEVE